MNSLNLIYPEKSDIDFRTMVFPDGQPHIKLNVASVNKLSGKDPLRILCRISNPEDLLRILFVKNALDYLEFEHVELHVSYLMAARMDRVMVDGEPFSLKVIAGILNDARFRKVRIFDPHSEVSTALIERAYAVPNHQFVKDVLEDYFKKYQMTPFCLVSPDAGALKKIHKLAQFLGLEDIVECMKERDVRTGQLTSFKTTAEELTGKTCFIVDDICDGGGTFVGTAKMLKEKGAQKVILVVSHGIFSKGTSIEFVDDVYSTDSYKAVEKINSFQVEKYMA